MGVKDGGGKREERLPPQIQAKRSENFGQKEVKKYKTEKNKRYCSTCIPCTAEPLQHE